MNQTILIAYNLRSAHNVGSLLRTADGLGVNKVYLTGYTPYPPHEKDARLPHEAAKISHLIHKTALGAENTVDWQYERDLNTVMNNLSSEGFIICALEQSNKSIELHKYKRPDKIALILGNEVTGLEKTILTKMDAILEIPMSGQKESFNVVQAAAMALYHLQFHNK